MLPRDYKNKIQRLTRDCELLADRITELRSNRKFLTGTSYDGVKVQTSPSGSSHAQDITERITDLEREYEAKCIALDENVKAFHNAIAQLDPKYSGVLHARWIEGKTLYDYALRNHYSYEHVKHLHNEAIREFEKSTPNNTE